MITFAYAGRYLLDAIEVSLDSLTRNLARESGTSRLIITGDFGIAAHYCDRVAVMQAGRIVEANTTEALFASPQHAYTKYIISSLQKINI